MSLTDILNHSLDFGMDPAAVRVTIALTIALACWQWPRDLRRYWAVWTRRGRRVTSWMLAVIIANGLAVWAAAARTDPLRVSTWILAATFVGLNTAMLLRFENDDTQERQYDHLIDLLLRR